MKTKVISVLRYDQLCEEFSIYAAESGMDREYGFDDRFEDDREKYIAEMVGCEYFLVDL